MGNNKTITEEISDIAARYPDCLVFLNLSNGLDAYQDVKSAGVPDDRIRFSYIQSTQLESRSHDVMLCSLGADLLMEVALGRCCVIVDFGCDKDVSRAVYQGIPFIKYCLKRKWFDVVDTQATISPRRFDGRPMPAADDFERRYKTLNRRTRSFIGKFAKYANMPSALERHHKEPLLLGVSRSGTQDGNPAHFVDTAAQLSSRLDFMLEAENK